MPAYLVVVTIVGSGVSSAVGGLRSPSRRTACVAIRWVFVSTCCSFVLTACGGSSKNERAPEPAPSVTLTADELADGRSDLLIARRSRCCATRGSTASDSRDTWPCSATPATRRSRWRRSSGSSRARTYAATAAAAADLRRRTPGFLDPWRRDPARARLQRRHLRQRRAH